MSEALRTETVSQTFLCEGTRFKLAFNRSGYTGALANFAKVLDGQWVALVAAEDDRHIELVREIERLRQEVQELTYQRDQAHAEAMSLHGAR